jgi:hypothetical protein
VWKCVNIIFTKFLLVGIIRPAQIIYNKQDSSVTEFTKSQSLAASTVTTSPGDSSISTDTVKSGTSKQPLEQRAGGFCKIQCKVKLYAGYARYMEQDPNGRKHCTRMT